MKIEFFMPMEIIPTTTHQEKKIHVVKGKPVVYEPAPLRVARAKLTAHLAKHIPPEPFAGCPIRLITKWCFKLTGKHRDGDYKITKPDVTNMPKLMEDIMTDLGFWTDDAIVASSITEKFWSEVPGIYVCVNRLDQ